MCVKFFTLGIALVLALTLVACGGDDGDDEPVAIEDATNCEQVVDAFIPVMQEVLDSVSELSMTDLMAEDTPDPLVDFEERMEAIGDKSDELNCSDEEMSELLVDRVDELEADGPVAEFLLEALKSEGLEQ